MTITIYHNPRCQTSRNVLAYLQSGGHEPRIIEYLKTPPSRAELERLVKKMGAGMRDILRWKEPIARQLGLDPEKSSERELLDAMMEHPILINRPIVVSGNAVKLCRPSESVKELF